MPSEVKLQALKENVETVEVDTVKVSAGDVVTKDQPLLVVQADKATLDVPAPFAGRIAKMLVKNGDQVKVGQIYCLIEETNGAPAGAPAAKPPAKGEAPAARNEQATPSKPAESAKSEESSKQATSSKPAEPRQTQPAPQAATAAAAATSSPTPAPAAEPETAKDAAAKPVLAGPATRRLARELGVDLHQVTGSGPNQRVTQEDIKAFVRQFSANAPQTVPAAGGVAAPPLPRFEDWGPVERQKLDAIRKQTARQMALAWSLIPHVTQHDLADVTDLESFRKQQEGRGPKLTVTAFMLKAAAIALQQFPTFNSSLDLANGQLVIKRYYHVGVAVDTDHGLLVPVLRDVDRKSVTELGRELTEIAERAGQRKIQIEEMRGGTFTITNLGGIGGTGFTPIVNYPEVAILGLSRSRLQPVVHEGQIVPRLLLPLSLSYDHRVIDGASAARFTRRLAEMLENPLQMLLHA